MLYLHQKCDMLTEAENLTTQYTGQYIPVTAHALAKILYSNYSFSASHF